MRFHKTLEKGQINEWKCYYIPYNELKVCMKKDRVLFVTKVNESLKLINDFYLRIERIVMNEKNKIRKTIEENEEVESETSIENHNKKLISADDCTRVKKSRFDLLNLLKWKDRYSYNQSEKELKRWIQGCGRIKRYVNLNYQGFRKILKKYDKMYKDNLSMELFTEIKESYVFKSTRIDKTLTELKEIYRVYYAKNDKRKAKSVFLNITKKEGSDQFSSFFAGMFIALSIFSCHVIKIRSFDDLNFIFYTNAFFYGLLLFGFCMILFRKYYINYKFILGLEVATCGTLPSYFLLVSTFMLITDFGFYVTSMFISIHNFVFILVSCIVLIFPFNILSRSSRFFFIKSILKILVTPLFPVQFCHFIIADCFLSFMPCLIGLFYIERKLFIFFSILPSIIRILQCIRRGVEEKMLRIQLINALKLTTSILFFCISQLHLKNNNYWTLIPWIILGFTASMFSFFWDLLIDWEFRRNDRIFPIFFFYAIILLNLFSRFSWFLLINYKKIAVILEITRRFGWLLIRTECEHLNNRDALRVLPGIDLKPSDMFYKGDDETDSIVSEDEKMDESVL